MMKDFFFVNLYRLFHYCDENTLSNLVFQVENVQFLLLVCFSLCYRYYHQILTSMFLSAYFLFIGTDFVILFVTDWL